jgi:hypothetical protein
VSEELYSATVQALYKNMLELRSVPPTVMLGAFCSARETCDTIAKHSLYNERKNSFAMMADDTGTGLSEAQRRVLVELSDDSMVHDSIMFVTDNDRAGLVYHPDFVNCIRVGDAVVGLFGYNLPFVLRKAETGPYYQVVNIAYVNEHILGQHSQRIPDEASEDHI